MKKKGEQFHPARDTRPPEYEVQGSGLHITGAGYYDKTELEQATASDRSYGDTDSPLLQPAQGRLFDVDDHMKMVRAQLGQQRLPATDPKAASIRDQTLLNSTIPTSHLQSRREGLPESRLTSKNLTIADEERSWEGSGMGGWYRGPATTESADVVAVNPASPTAFVHELGHRRHLGEQAPYDIDYTQHPSGNQYDPLKEGVADAYVDRYQPGSVNVRNMKEDIEETGGISKFSSYQFTGYSTDKEAATGRGWNSDDRALYAATRAHASETGEQALYVPRGRDVREQQGIADYGSGNPTVDATLHSLLSTSPHAAKALRETGLKDVGARAFRRHRDRQLLTEGQTVQGSLFHEMTGLKSGKVLGYTPAIDATAEHLPLEQRLNDFDADFARVEEQHGEGAFPMHMSHNQFGEKPRTQAEVANSLGVSRVHSSKLGFTDR